MQISVEDIKTIHVEPDDTLLVMVAKEENHAILDRFLETLEKAIPNISIVITDIQANLTIVRRRKGE